MKKKAIKCCINLTNVNNLNNLDNRLHSFNVSKTATDNFTSNFVYPEGIN